MKITAHKIIKNTLLLVSTLALFTIIGYFAPRIFAAGQSNVLGQATVMNTGNKIDFNSTTYASNVVISDPDPGNNNRRTISGYAWSTDIGWIKFTSGETAGVYVAYSTGLVSGSAYVVNTGGTLDFDNNGSHVVVDTQTGIFSGYVWSNDLGWIDFGDGDVYVKDSKKPENVSNVDAFNDSSKTITIENTSALYNWNSPYFEWTVPIDPDDTSEYASGIAGYFVYWGTDETTVPETQGTFQTANNFTSPTLTGTDTYYLRIQAVDAQGNIFTGDLASYTLFTYHFDGDKPTNVSYISMPSSSFGNIREMFFSWPSSGSVASSDNSAVLGWQYSINDTNSWTGSAHEDRLGIDYIPLVDSDYTYYFDADKDGPKIIVGNNIIYFRTVDTAGNVSVYVSGGISYGGQAPKFEAEAQVTVTPNSSDSNSFSLSWPAALAGEGRTVAKYYYMVNTNPPSSYATLANNSSLYIPVDGTSVSTRMLKGAIKGSNTVYVVAVDDQDGYSSSNVITGTFVLNSSLPDPVLNLSLVDSSIKEAELWRASLSWGEPVYKGDGNLSYHVLRSLNGQNWAEIGTTTGLSYTDIVSESATYYYKVLVTDGTDESKANPTPSASYSVNLKGQYTSPALLVSGIVLTEVAIRHATVNWITDRASDTKIMYGTTSGQYFDEELYNSVQTTDHKIRLNSLQADTIYYFKAKWTDEDGNTGMSQEISFRTDPMPEVITSKVERVGLDFATISFEVKGASKASVYYGKGYTYTGLKEINTSPVDSKYTVILDELSDGTTYNYKISLTDPEGYSYDSIETHSFTTPPMPRISNVTIQELKDVASPTIVVSWFTNTETSSIVTYTAEEGKMASVDKLDTKMKAGSHSMSISGLNPMTRYVATVEGIDKLGNKATSDEIRFTTATDTRPPKITNIKVQGDLLSRNIQSERSRSAQLIVSWETDEPSTSRVEYGEGTSGIYNYSTQTDSELRTKHVVVISGLTPSKVYSIGVVSVDTAENEANSTPIVTITPKASNTVLETVLNSLGNIFSFFQ